MTMLKEQLIRRSNDAMNSVLSHASLAHLQAPLDSTLPTVNISTDLPKEISKILYHENNGDIDIKYAVKWIKRSTPSLLCLLLLSRITCILKSRLIDFFIVKVPLVGKERDWYRRQLSSSWLLGMYSVQAIPKDFSQFFQSSFENTSSSWGKMAIPSISLSKKRIGAKVKGLSKLNSLQANCLGLLARPREIFPQATSLTDIPSYVNDTKIPLERYIHDELVLLETVCSSMNDLELHQSIMSENFDPKLFIHRAVTRLETCSERIKLLTNQFDVLLEKYRRPTFFERNWVYGFVIGFSIVYIDRTVTFPVLASRFINGLYGISDTVSSFINQWIIRPSLDIIKTIRHKEPKLAIMGSKSLESDLEVFAYLIPSL
jgi:ATP synthase regulation protein NCA2